MWSPVEIILEIDSDKCINCGVCINACPVNVISE